MPMAARRARVIRPPFGETQCYKLRQRRRLVANFPFGLYDGVGALVKVVVAIIPFLFELGTRFLRNSKPPPREVKSCIYVKTPRIVFRYSTYRRR